MLSCFILLATGCLTAHRVLTQETLASIYGSGTLALCLCIWRQSSHVSHLRGSKPFHCWCCGHNWLSVFTHWAVVATRVPTLGLVLLILHHFDMQVIIPFISPEIFRTWKSFSEQSKDCQERVTWDFFVNFLKLSRIDPLLALKAHF